MNANFFRTFVLDDLVKVIDQGDVHNGIIMWQGRSRAMGKCANACGPNINRLDTVACGQCLAKKLSFEDQGASNGSACAGPYEASAQTLLRWLEVVPARAS